LSDIIKPSDEDQLYNIEGFSQEEQEEIRAQIDLISGQNRIPVSEELFKITPTKKGGTLPLIINIIGIISIIGGFYFTNNYFQEKEQTMAMEESTYESTEGSVIEELKRQAEEKLNKKQEEISLIQDELSKLDRESASLKENMDNQIKDKELELRSEMESALAEERARLQSQNISTSDLEKQLEEFQTNRENAFNADIEAFKDKSALAIKEKEEELAKSKQIANDILVQANLDKKSIEADTLQREAELTAQFEEERQALTRESSEATQKLEELSDLQRNEQLIQDQLTGSFNSIIESIRAVNYPEAKIGIDNARQLLEDPQLLRLPSIAKRKDIELYFLNSLEKEIQQAGVRTTTDFTSLTRAAEVLLSARQSAEYGTEAEKTGSIYEAKRFYNEALASLPQISKAVENLNSIEARDRTALSSEYLDLGNKAIGSGQLNEAIKQYRSAALGTVPDNIESLSRAIDGIEQALKEDNEKLLSAANKDLQNLKSDSDSTLNELTSELKTKEAALEKLRTDVESLESSKTELEAEKSLLEESVAATDKNEEELLNNVDTLSTQIEDSKKTIDQLNQKITESKKTIDGLNTDVRKAEFAIEALTKKAARAASRAENLEIELNDAVNQIVELIN
jgi:peptidoglycan hydrolase CwlO-like protein